MGDEVVELNLCLHGTRCRHGRNCSSICKAIRGTNPLPCFSHELDMKRLDVTPWLLRLRSVETELSPDTGAYDLPIFRTTQLVLGLCHKCTLEQRNCCNGRLSDLQSLQKDRREQSRAHTLQRRVSSAPGIGRRKHLGPASGLISCL